MEPATIILITKLLPLVIDLTTQIVDAAKEGGIEIPEIEELKALNKKLSELEDL